MRIAIAYYSYAKCRVGSMPEIETFHNNEVSYFYVSEGKLRIYGPDHNFMLDSFLVENIVAFSCIDSEVNV